MRRVQNIKVELSPIPSIRPAKEAADKMLRLIDPYPLTSGKDSHSTSLNNFISLHYSQNMMDPNAQQSTNTKSPMSQLMQQKEKVRKIIKFEKIMNRLCKDIGVDKRTLLSIFGGSATDNIPSKVSELESSNIKNDQKDQISRESGSLQNLATPLHHINTGQAA